MTDLVTVTIDNTPIEVLFYDENTLEAQLRALQAEAALGEAVVAKEGAELARDAAVAGASSAGYRPTLAEAITDFTVGQFFTSDDQDEVTTHPNELRLYERIVGSPFYLDQGDEAAPVGRFFLSQDETADRIGTASGETVQAALDKLRLAPSGDTTGETDTRRFRALVTAGLPIKLDDFDGTNAYYLCGDVTADVPADAPGKQYKFGVFGNPGAPDDQKPRIIVKKGGVTAFPCSWASQFKGCALEYDDVDDVPAVGGLTWPYARCVATTGTISTVSDKLRLTVSGGLIGTDEEFPNVTRGSIVVALADDEKPEDYWVNNYVDEDSVFQIDEVISDTVCTLQGKAGSAYTGPVHIRGNGPTTVWTQFQPSNIEVTHNSWGNIPGCGFMTMGVQFLDCANNNTLGIGAPHFRMVYAGNGQGLNFDNGQGSGWGNGGTYHQSAIHEQRAFYACGGYAIGGPIDTSIEHNQIDPNAVDDTFAEHAVINTYFSPPTGIHRFGGSINVNYENITCEDSPRGIEFFQVSLSRIVHPHTYDLGFDTHPLTINGCSNLIVELPRFEAGPNGDPSKKFQYIGQGDGPESEVTIEYGGRHGRVNAVYQNGVFGKEVSSLDVRDLGYRKLALSASVLEASSSGVYVIDLPLATFGGFAGFTEYVLASVLLEHSKVWAGSFPGNSPTIECGTPSASTKYFGALNLDVAASTYIKLNAITGFAEQIMDAASSVRFTIRSGGGGAFNNGTFDAGNLTIWIRIYGVRA